MEEKKIICTICPIGCNITVKGEKGKVKEIEGNLCKRGEEYARNEFLNPKRILTSTVKINNYKLPVVSVRSDKPVPKELLFKCMEIIKKVEIDPPIFIGKIVVENILDTGVNIIVTKE